jgi:hypothetical protein
VRFPPRPRGVHLFCLSALVASVGCRTGVPLDTGDFPLVPLETPVPYGFWGLNGYQSPEGFQDLQDRFALSAFHTSTHAPNYGVSTLLPAVRRAGLKVNLRLTGNHTYYTDDHGNFDMDAWKEMLDPWVDSGVQDFIDDGTLAHHMLLDDIVNFTGTPPSGDDLDEMARYSKSLLPGLAVVVREEASRIPVPSAGSFEHLDANINQYMADYGNVVDYMEGNLEAAEILGLETINGLNIADGGDGSSGQPGWKGGFYAMSAEEIVDYGGVLSSPEDLRMFLCWEYDGEEQWSDGSIGSDYFDQPELVEALQWLGLRLSGEDLPRP